MEKIYDESQQQLRQKKQNKRKKVKVDGVSMLCFAVAAFAIVSLIAVGFSGTSYALPTSTSESIATSFKAREYGAYYLKDTTTDQEVDYHYLYTSDATDAKAFDSGNHFVICLERAIDFEGSDDSGKDFTNSGTTRLSDNAGLLYLLANLQDSTDASDTDLNWDLSGVKYSSTSVVTDNNKLVEFWAAQMAVWKYLEDTGDPSNVVGATTSSGSKLDSSIKTVSSATEIEVIDSSSDATSFTISSTTSTSLFDSIKVNGSTISQLIETAESMDEADYGISISSDGLLQQDDAKSYYFSGPYTVTSKLDSHVGKFEAYTVDLENAPEGTVVTDSSYNPITAESDGKYKMTGSQFYVRVPADKVTQSTDIKINIAGTFNMYEGYRYMNGGSSSNQTVTYVQFVNDTKTAGTSFTVAPAPDTGLSAGVTVYFIGLIVLLCGVGIIYANAKPSTQN